MSTGYLERRQWLIGAAAQVSHSMLSSHRGYPCEHGARAPLPTLERGREAGIGLPVMFTAPG